MKLKHQEKYFINGIVLVILAVLGVTFLPILIKEKTIFEVPNYIYFHIEFFALCASAIFFLFSPKYYKEQILIIFLGIIYYCFFARMF